MLGNAAVADESNIRRPWLLGEDEGYCAVPVSSIVQRDMYEAACGYLEKVYPDIDKEWMRKECGSALLQDRYPVFRADRGFWPSARAGTEGLVRLEITFPWHDRFLLDARKPPPGAVLEKLSKPLTLADAEGRARVVLARVLADPNRARRFSLERSGEAQNNYYYFDFRERGDPSLHYILGNAYVEVRRSDGFIRECDLRTQRLRPKVPYEKVVEMAKAAGRTGDRTDDIVLYTHYNGGIGTVTWDYGTPPDMKMGGVAPVDETWWDATSGELLFSMVLRGGTPEKPYKNPKFFTEVNDEVIKRNLAKLIADRVTELEKK